MKKNPAVTPEPLPPETENAEMWPLVVEMTNKSPIPNDVKADLIADMQARDAFGRAKYGRPLRVADGRDSATDAYQEILDLAVYALKCVIETQDPFWVKITDNAIGEAAGIRAWLTERDAQR